MGSDDLKQRLRTEPENLANQLRAMVSLSDWARDAHRKNFDVYLEASADVLDEQRAKLAALEEQVEAMRRKLRELGVELIDDVDEHVRALINKEPKE